MTSSSSGKGYSTTIPKDAAEYLRNVEWSPGVKYLQGDEGFLILVKDLPQGAKEIVPVKVDGEGKVALTEWFEKVFSKKPEYEKYFYLDEKGKIRINWNELGNSYMLLEIEASKGRERITRLFAFAEREQEIIRVRVGELAKKDEIVECVLRLVDAEDFLQDKYEVSGEVAQEVVRRTYKVMQYETREELDAALATADPRTKNDLIGAWGEWKVFQIICEHKNIFGEIIGCQVKYPEGKPETVIDFITDKYIIEVKNWDWDVQSNSVRMENINHLLNQMEVYKMAQDAKYNGKRVIILFYREIPDDVIGDETKGLMSELLKIFQDEAKFQIINGIRNVDTLR
jgi:hypothetical protein